MGPQSLKRVRMQAFSLERKAFQTGLSSNLLSLGIYDVSGL